jgi:hypothetical protein
MSNSNMSGNMNKSAGNTNSGAAGNTNSGTKKP